MPTVNIEFASLLEGVLQFISYMGLAIFAENVILARALGVTRLLKLVPDLDPSIIEFLRRYDKVILEGYGAGGIPIRLEKVVQKLILSGTKVYITTQCLEGEVDLHKYAVGRRAEAMGAVSLGHRTVEDAIASIQCSEI